jgi:hypothetical protein
VSWDESWISFFCLVWLVCSEITRKLVTSLKYFRPFAIHQVPQRQKGIVYPMFLLRIRQQNDNKGRKLRINHKSFNS